MQRKRWKRLLSSTFLYWLIIYASVTFFYSVYIKIYSSSYQPQELKFRATQLFNDYQCKCNVSSENSKQISPEINYSMNTTIRRILLLTNPSTPNKQRKSLSDLFYYFKVPIRLEQYTQNNLPLFEIGDMARFTLIIFEDYRDFHLLSKLQKKLLHEICTKHSIGIISFLLLNEKEQFNTTDFNAVGGQKVEKIYFTTNWPIRKLIGKIDCPFSLQIFEQENWTVFKTASKSIPLLIAEPLNNDSGHEHLSLLLSKNHLLFSIKPELHWTIKIALLDAISYLAPNIYQEDFERYIQVDIDDVFVGASGSRFTADDIRALLITQEELRQNIDEFKFTMGFSGYYFRHGNQVEIEGDELLLANSDQFLWFPHMWRHNHAHEHSPDYLLALMVQNGVFANNSRLLTKLQYAISPQHSGVYPIYEALYNGWKQIWNVKVTSTEEYPHFKPASKRRGFIHSNISVLPRQTCGLYTHTQFLYAYPGGLQRFMNNIFGGDLFTTILMNKFSIFMTHQQNFANDRLGSFTFINLIKFIKCHTNLKLKWILPTKMSELYFQHYPEEKTLLYTDFSTDNRHRRMLHANHSSSNWKLPNLIILGPQKTGTTALAMFLQHLHPNISTNLPIPSSFEELQFFAGPNYAKGIDWYAEKFSNISVATSTVIFEKTANYFDNPAAPEAIHALIPNAKLLVILSDPVKRAYSWYQHMRVHNDSIATKYSAEEIFMNNSSKTEKLRRRAIWPGFYAKHLDRWLDFFNPSQFLIVDGERLRMQPHFVLKELFEELGLQELNEIHRRLQFSKEKGFYCLVRNDVGGTNLPNKKLWCLGSSKGRHYSQMSHRLMRYLETIFSQPNESLKTFLRKYQFPLPSFLTI